MIILNLVSSAQKKETKLRHAYGFIKTASLSMIFVVVFITIFFLISKLILQSKYGEVIRETSLGLVTTRSYINNVQEINTKLNYIKKIQDEFIPWSELIGNLANAASSDINFYYLKINSDDQTVKIKGTAKQRSSLLEFKSKMAETPYFKDIEFPIKNILEKENVDFEINAKLNLTNI